jgi:type VI protein secretion system component Hcp
MTHRAFWSERWRSLRMNSAHGPRTALFTFRDKERRTRMPIVASRKSADTQVGRDNKSEESVMRISAPILVVAALASSAAYAQQTIVFNMATLEKPVRILSFNTSAMNAGGKVICGAVNLVKPLDTASPLLIANVFTGRIIPDALIRVRVDKKLYYDVLLQNVTVTNVQQSQASTEPVLSENVTLQAVKYTFKFYSPRSQFGWDCGAHRPL